MKITFVKKILADGSPCRKCADVQKRLDEAGQMARIDEVLIADERDPESPGMRLAAELAVERAPFFVVEDNGERRVWTVYFKFVKEVFGGSEGKASDAARDIYDSNPDLDYV
ncbi:MAG TPA: hypothetical protein VLA56_08130 [Pseudomonadales bacterium]|nr:hypothetical protein [Pseudomonadales bacterium]